MKVLCMYDALYKNYREQMELQMSLFSHSWIVMWI